MSRAIFPSQVANTVSRVYDWLSRRTFVAGTVVMIVAFLFAAAASAARGFPLPRVHDEFSYLLGAETFASGRLTNPTHPMWRHFESQHLLQRPSYNSKFPPANAVFLAIGTLLTGKPIVGVWIEFAFMCTALYWMLTAWIGDEWALGLSVAFVSGCAASYWSYSYWGGAIAAGAAALVFGSLYRIVERRAGWGSAALLAAGLLLLANSRPFEGLLASLPPAAVFIGWFMRDWRSTWRRKMNDVLIPFLLVAVPGAVCMAIYFHAVTGSWYEMPYTAYDETHQTLPRFIFERSHRTDPQLHQYVLTPFVFMNYLRSFVTDFVGLVIPGIVLVPLLLIPLAARNRRTRFALITIGSTAIGMAFSTFFLAHYAAPLVGAVLIVYGGCLRWLSRLRVARKPIGNRLAVAVLGLWMCTGIAATTLALMSRKRGSTDRPSEWPAQRKLIADTLSRGGRKNLIVVKYIYPHSPNSEWVYNRANIDASNVVWAHDLGDAANQELLDYFRGRSVWRMTINEDEGPYLVTRY